MASYLLDLFIESVSYVILIDEVLKFLFYGEANRNFEHIKNRTRYLIFHSILFSIMLY